jgi:sortase A
VVSVEKVNENDTSGLNPTANDQITMYTCVRNQRDNRWKVVAVAN